MAVTVCRGVTYAKLGRLYKKSAQDWWIWDDKRTGGISSEADPFCRLFPFPHSYLRSVRSLRPPLVHLLPCWGTKRGTELNCRVNDPPFWVKPSPCPGRARPSVQGCLERHQTHRSLFYQRAIITQVTGPLTVRGCTLHSPINRRSMRPANLRKRASSAMRNRIQRRLKRLKNGT